MCVRAYEWRNAAHNLCSVCQDGTAFQSCVKKKWIHNIETFLIFFSTLFPRPPLLQKLCCGWPSGPLGRHATCVLGRLPLLPVSQPQGATCSRRVFSACACCEVGSRVGVRSRSVQVGNLSSSQPPPHPELGPIVPVCGPLCGGPLWGARGRPLLCLGPSLCRQRWWWWW